MKPSTQLTFDGNCEEAFKYYEKTLGAKITSIMRWGESPMKDRVPKEYGNRVIHGTINIAGMDVGGGDAPPQMYRKPQGMMVGLDPQRPEEAERVFAALSDGGLVTMKLEETFWAKRFGMCVDRFGIPWMINCGKQP